MALVLALVGLLSAPREAGKAQTHKCGVWAGAS